MNKTSHKTKDEGATLVGRIALRVLREALAADPAALTELLTYRVPVNHRLAAHRTIVCGLRVVPNLTGPRPKVLKKPKTRPHLGPLGLINGILTALSGDVIGMESEPGKFPQITGFASFKKAKLSKDVIAFSHRRNAKPETRNAKRET